MGLAAHITYKVAGFFGKAVQDKVRDVADSFSKEDNGVTADPVSTAHVKIAGLEKELSVPGPSAKDREWAKGYANVSTEDVGEALKGSITRGNNWRVFYLVNRPFRPRQVEENKGFHGSMLRTEALDAAARVDNVTAAWLLIKHAEKQPVESDMPREELLEFNVRAAAFEALAAAAAHKADKMFDLALGTLGKLSPTTRYYGASVVYEDDPVEKAIAYAANSGRADYLDKIAEKGAVPGRFHDAYRRSFHDGLSDLKEESRPFLLDWMKKKGIADESYFLPEARAMVARIGKLHAAREKGWRLDYAFAHALKVGEKTVSDRNGQVAAISRDGLNYVFNFQAGNVQVENEQGQLVRFQPLAEFADHALAEEGHAFLKANRLSPPPLPWSKAAP